MSKAPMLSCWLFVFFLYGGVCFVPPPTNISVVCHNLVNVLYWNYSKPSEDMKFIVTVEPYIGLAQTVDTSEMYLDISEYTSDVSDNYFVTVKGLDGQEESNITFTYSKSMIFKSTHKCSVDFPPIEMPVRKDIINVSFSHPYYIYHQESLKDDFTYKVTHDEKEISFDCYYDEELCIAEIHLGQSEMGKCIDLTFEATVDVLFSTFNKNVCLSKMPDASDAPIIAAVVGGGIVLLFVVLGFVWLLCKKWSSIPKIPEVLINFMTPNKPASVIHHHLETPVSSVSPESHSPLLQTEDPIAFAIPTVSPHEVDPSFTPHDTEVVMDPETSCTSGGDVNFESEESEDYGKSSDYDSPKFLQEMSPGDFTTGYGPRPSVL